MRGQKVEKIFEVIFGWDLMFAYGTLLMVEINNDSDIHLTLLLGMQLGIDESQFRTRITKQEKVQMPILWKVIFFEVCLFEIIGII